MKFIKKLWSNKSGYGVIELMIIIAILGSIAFIVGNKFTTNCEKSADSVAGKIDEYIETWGVVSEP